MNRKEYIELLVKLAAIRFKCGEDELSEIRIALEAMPDSGSVLRASDLIPDINHPQPQTPKKPTTYPFRPVTLLYGVAMPDSSIPDYFDNLKNYNSSSTATFAKIENGDSEATKKVLNEEK